MTTSIRTTELDTLDSTLSHTIRLGLSSDFTLNTSLCLMQGLRLSRWLAKKTTRITDLLIGHIQNFGDSVKDSFECSCGALRKHQSCEFDLLASQEKVLYRARVVFRE